MILPPFPIHAPLPIEFGIARDVRIVEDRSFEGGDTAHPRDTRLVRPTTGRFSWKGEISVRRGHARSWGKLRFSRRAIRHSSAAQLLLPRTWSERGTGNLLGSEISEVLLIANSRALSLRFQHRVRGVLLVFEPRGIYSPLKYVKLTSVSYCTKQKVLSRYRAFV